MNSVQTYLKSVLNGLALPPPLPDYPIPSLQAVIGPSTISSPKGPQVYLRVRRFTQRRLSGPPGEGTLELTHDVNLTARWQFAVTRLATEGIDPVSAFSIVVDTILLTLNAQPKSHIRVVDPYTGKKSELGLIGDAQSGELRGPWAIQDQREQLHGADLTAVVRELMRG